MTNYLACQASGADASLKTIDDLVNNMPSDCDKTYELIFNLSQVQFRLDEPELSLKTLQDAFELAKNDMDENEETKFKIQELHILNNLKRSFSHV
jgi:hypothetical protein